MGPQEVWEFVRAGGLGAGMAFFIFALWKGWLYWGKDVDEMKEAHKKDQERLERALELSQTENRGYIEALKARLDRWEAREEQLRRGSG